MAGFSVVANIDGLNLNDSLSPLIVAAVQSAIQTSLALVRDRWQTEVQNRLNSARPLYLQGLDFDSVKYPYGNSFTGAVVLKGKLPNMLELGFSAFDEKIGFSKSPRIKKKKNGGWYLTIPYRHSTPGHFMYGGEMPKNVHNKAKKLDPYGTQGGNSRLKWPGAGNVSWTGYQWKTNKYNGMVRIVKSYQNATQSQYMTFRRVSDKSDPLSWQHPGYAGVKAAEKIMPYVEKTFVEILKNNLKGLS